MTEYRRARVPGATWFFTVGLAERWGNGLLVERVEALRSAFRTVRERHPFRIDAVVVCHSGQACIFVLFSNTPKCDNAGPTHDLPNYAQANELTLRLMDKVDVCVDEDAIVKRHFIQEWWTDLLAELVIALPAKEGGQSVAKISFNTFDSADYFNDIKS